MVRWLGVVFALALVALSPAGARGQQMGFASGEVVDESGAPVAGATVRLQFLGEVERVYTAKTDKKGRYTQGLISGRYRVTVSKDGFQGTFLDHAIKSGDPTELPKLTIVSREKVVQDAMAPILAEFDKASGLAKAGKLDEALVVYGELAAAHPDLPEAHLNIGTLYVRQEKWPEAEAALAKTLELAPDNRQARVLLATVHSRQGRTEEARAEMEKLRSENPGDPRLSYELGAIHLEAKRYEEAYAAFEQVRKLDPGNADVLYLLGTISLNLGKLDGARSNLQAYLQAAPADGRYRDLATELVAQLDKSQPQSP
jgi:tetratricopeptide (TPR) repeat protein